MSASEVEATNKPPALPLGRSTLPLGLLGAALCYLAHPPAGLSLLAWIGPAPWVLLTRLPRLPGRRPYAALWLAGAAYWLATIQWIRLPYWANIFGLLLLAAYLGAYLPAFVALGRVAVHRLHVPPWLAAPIAWTGLEWLRARLFTGFLMGSLAHTQVHRVRVMQFADVLGEYGVTFLIVLVAAAFAGTMPLSWVEASPSGESASGRRETPRWRALVPAALALAAALGYGEWRLRDAAATAPGEAASRELTVALIQSDMRADWKGTAERDAAVMRQLDDLSRQAVRESAEPVDLVVWPETMYRDPLTMLDPGNGPLAAMFDAEQLDATRRGARAKAAEWGAALLVGIDRYVAVSDDAVRDESGRRVGGYRIDGYNSSALVDRSGALVGTYDKMHLLPFGEYIPFVRWLPFLRSYSPITGGAIPGEVRAAVGALGELRLSVSICYETVLPQLIRRQFGYAVRQTGRSPDLMVNLTNDAWYWGSSELDMHLASGVFRAVGMRTPLVVAANRGLSAHVDAWGRIVAVTERDVPAALVARVRLPPLRSGYPSLFARWGDWLAVGCLICCMVAPFVGRRRGRRPPAA